MFNIFAATYAPDATEGRLPDAISAYFTNRKDAEIASKGKGVQGQDSEIQVLPVYGSFAEWKAARGKVLSRQDLSDFERAVADLLESGSFEGCDSSTIVTDARDYKKVQELLAEMSGLFFGEDHNE